jgi:HK97 family phage portal protein
MGLLTRLAAAIRPPAETRASGFYAPAGFSLMTGGGPVTPWQAENLSTVVACVNAIGGGLGALPAAVYRSLGDAGRIEAPNHPVSRLLRAPNRHQSWPDFVEWTVAQQLLWGNALSVIESDGAGRPTALRPVPWQHVQPELLPNGSMVYNVVMYQTPWGGSGFPRRFLDSEVMHLRDRSDDGYVGRSRLSRAPEVLNAAIGLQSYSAAVWTNAATASGLMTVGTNPTPDGVKRMQASFDERHTGARNAKRVIWADAGTTFTPMSVSPEDAEVLASRRFTVEELCRLFNCPPPIVQSYEFNTFTNSAQANTWFATNTLRPIARKIEAEFARSVFADPGGEFHLEIDLSGLMRGDYATRWAANVAAVAAGILTADEVRDAEGYGPISTADNPQELPAA